MSAQNAKFAQNSKSIKKPYCKVCHDAGKPESVYTSHCVKTYNINIGKLEVTCPTLKALECRYCFKNGHTVKFCPVLEDNCKLDAERARERARENSRNVQARPVEKSEEKRKPNNAFAALADDSDEETQVEVAKASVVSNVEVAKVDEFPTLGGGSSSSRNAVVRSYSSIAATPADEVRLGALRKAQAAKPVKWVDEVEEVSDSEDEEDEVVSSVPYVAPTNTAASAPYMRSYADDDDW
jgi:hypothetical protein